MDECKPLPRSRRSTLNPWLPQPRVMGDSQNHTEQELKEVRRVEGGWARHYASLDVSDAVFPCNVMDAPARRARARAFMKLLVVFRTHSRRVAVSQNITTYTAPWTM